MTTKEKMSVREMSGPKTQGRLSDLYKKKHSNDTLHKACCVLLLQANKHNAWNIESNVCIIPAYLSLGYQNLGIIGQFFFRNLKILRKKKFCQEFLKIIYVIFHKLLSDPSLYKV